MRPPPPPPPYPLFYSAPTLGPPAPHPSAPHLLSPHALPFHPHPPLLARIAAPQPPPPAVTPFSTPTPPATPPPAPPPSVPISSLNPNAAIFRPPLSQPPPSACPPSVGSLVLAAPAARAPLALDAASLATSALDALATSLFDAPFAAAPSGPPSTPLTLAAPPLDHRSSLPPQAAAAVTAAAASAPPTIVSLASASPAAAFPYPASHSKLPPPSGPSDEDAMTQIMDCNLADFAAPITLPAPATGLSSDAAFHPPIDQPGLVLAPPSPQDWIVPTRPPFAPTPQQRSKQPFSAVPVSSFGTPGQPLPVITTDPSADAIHANGRPNRGYKQTFRDHSGAVSHILAHYAHHGFPPGMCRNCFTYHGYDLCASPTYHWSSLLGRHHPRCPICHELHFPPCSPALPSLH